MLTSSMIDPRSTMLLTGMKELILLIFVASLMLASRRIRLSFHANDLAYGLFILYILMSALLSESPLYAVLVSSRDFIVIFAMYFIGRLCFKYIDSDEIIYLFRALLFIVFILALSATFLYFFMDDSRWMAVGLGSFMENKFSNANFYEKIAFGQMPSNFSTYWFGQKLPRSVGTVLDAPTLSRLLAIGIVLTMCQVACLRRSREFTDRLIISSFALITIFTFAQILTLGRSGMLMSLIGLLTILYLRPWTRLLFFLGLIALALVTASLIQSKDANTMTHLNGLVAGLDQLTFAGHGLGSAGQAVMNFSSETATNRKVKESFIGSIFYQIGLLGGAAFALTFIISFRVLYSSFRIAAANGAQASFAYVLLSGLALYTGIVAGSFLSTSAIGFTSAFVPFFILGWSTSYILESSRMAESKKDSPYAM
ncbi:hypothetical protein N9052_01335 [bacterium]|nr:hypothetical protein [bacterium]